MQAFNAKMDKESSGEGSDSGEMELDYEDLRVLPDAEEVAVDDDIIVVGTRSPAVQTSSPAGLDDDDATNTQETIDDGAEGKKSSGPWDGTVSHNPGSPRVLWTSSQFKWSRESPGCSCYSLSDSLIWRVYQTCSSTQM